MGAAGWESVRVEACFDPLDGSWQSKHFICEQQNVSGAAQSVLCFHAKGLDRSFKCFFVLESKEVLKYNTKYKYPWTRVLRFFWKLSSGGSDSQRGLRSAAPEHTKTPAWGLESTCPPARSAEAVSVPACRAHVWLSHAFSLQWKKLEEMLPIW